MYRTNKSVGNKCRLCAVSVLDSSVYITTGLKVFEVTRSNEVDLLAG